MALLGSDAAAMRTLLEWLTRVLCTVKVQSAVAGLDRHTKQLADVVILFTNLGICATSGSHIAEEVHFCISKADVAFQIPNHLWRQRYISLPLKGS
ncbi:unnamed protein product, partial [Dicrocoelium dendriticum]